MNAEWAPVEIDEDGVEQIDAEWVAANHDKLSIVDVREPDEFSGPLGHIDGARLIPLAQLPMQLDTIERAKPVVTVCLSGGRSAQAWMLLRHAGLGQVANLDGGMRRWHELGLPVSR